MAERVLISRLSSMGDVVCSLPAAGAMKRAFPECHVTWLVDPRFRALVEACRWVDAIVSPKLTFSPRTWPKWPHRFDVALDLQGLLKSSLPVGLAKADRKLGYHWQRELGQVFTDRVLPDSSSLHVVDQYVDVARAAGGQAHRAEFGLDPQPDARASISDKLAGAGWHGGPYAVINPGAAWATKRWPATHFGRVIEGLAEQGVEAVLIGTKEPSERQVVLETQAASGNRAIDLSGQTTIAELIALIAGAAVHLGGDTGSTHIAAALGVPAVGLYSITNPLRSCPYGQIERCLYDPERLASIPAESVIEVVDAALQRPQP